ncbi:MAG UNVERIFIED_CONTAM: formylglycine-generating enzyme family protein [Planctomycetaceae bacterium]|jgi:formylglycine-generating enzyme required for sulfatase activity
MKHPIIAPLVMFAAFLALIAAIFSTSGGDEEANAIVESASALTTSDTANASSASTGSTEPPPEPAADDPRLKDMLWIPPGRFRMGALNTVPDEFPPHSVQLDGFWMDRTEVTNRQFQAFVESTGYVTLAEQPPKLRSIQPDSALSEAQILPEFNKPGSICSLQLGSRGDIDPNRGGIQLVAICPRRQLEAS